LQQLPNLDEFDAVINLAGEPIVGRRWTKAQKQAICSSRIDTTKTLVDLFAQSNSPPSVFLSGSAIGVYGDTGTEKTNETSPLIIDKNDFAQTLCQDWEHIANQAVNTRVVNLRTGIVLGNGGALSQMLPAFKLGLGGPLASGEQYMSWIHQDDIIQAVYFILEQSSITGAVNLVAPNPVTNLEFTKALGSACNRWTPFRVPKFVLNALLGESSQLLIDSQRIIPEQLINHEFQFIHNDIKSAFGNLINKR
jgi:uncharacterized protein (TIGR01777 family)